MAELEDLGDILSTDVLIVGGGIGGLATAIRVKEENPPASNRASWFGNAFLVYAIGQVVEFAPFFPTEFSVPLRITYVIAALIFYICFTMPEWFKKRIGWES